MWKTTSLSRVDVNVVVYVTSLLVICETYWLPVKQEVIASLPCKEEASVVLLSSAELWKAQSSLVLRSECHLCRSEQSHCEENGNLDTRTVVYYQVYIIASFSSVNVPSLLCLGHWEVGCACMRDMTNVVVMAASLCIHWFSVKQLTLVETVCSGTESCFTVISLYINL